MNDVVDVDQLIDGLIEREGEFVDHPAGDESIGVEQVDGVVEDRLNEELERLLRNRPRRQLEFTGHPVLLRGSRGCTSAETHNP